MNRFSLLMLLSHVVFQTNAQDRLLNSQYLLNPYLVNPAVGGSGEENDIKVSFRRQWTGFNDGPQTIYVSGSGHLGQHIGPNKGRSKTDDLNHHGIGGIILNQKSGLFNNIRVYGSYAYHIQLTKSIRGSIGTFVGVHQFSIDYSRIVSENASNFNSSELSVIKPDVGFGIWLNSKKWFGGISGLNLISSTVSVLGNNANVNNSIYYVLTGVKLSFSEDFSLIPSTLVRFSNSTYIAADFSAKLKYKDLLWAGTSYRTQNDLVFLMGTKFLDRFQLGYSMDVPAGERSSIFGTSHEIILGIIIYSKDQVRSPSDFWK